MGLVVLLGIGFGVFWAFLVWTTVRALLWPPRRSYAWCVAKGQPSDPGELTPAREFELGSVTEPARPHAVCPTWVIGGEDPGGPVVVYCHGWGESRQSVLQRLGALLPVCSRLIAWDMPGHGEASKGCARMGTTEHRALVALVDEETGDAPVVLMGFSFGGGICLRAALERPARVAGVIAEAPSRLAWTPARNVMRMAGYPYRLNLRPALFLAGVFLDGNPMWRGFDRARLAAGLACPLLVLHAVGDEMCPVEDGRAIAGAAPAGEIVELEGASHQTVWQEEETRDRACEAVRGFVLGLRGRGACS